MGQGRCPSIADIHQYLFHSVTTDFGSDDHFLPGIECAIEGQKAGEVAGFPDHDVFGEGAVATAEDLIARLEPGDLLTDRFDDTSEVDADARILGRTEARAHAHHIGLAANGVPVGGVDAGGVDLDEDLVVRGNRLFDFFQREDIGRSVAAADDGAPRVSAGPGWHEASWPMM